MIPIPTSEQPPCLTEIYTVELSIDVADFELIYFALTTQRDAMLKEALEAIRPQVGPTEEFLNRMDDYETCEGLVRDLVLDLSGKVQTRRNALLASGLHHQLQQQRHQEWRAMFTKMTNDANPEAHD